MLQGVEVCAVAHLAAALLTFKHGATARTEMRDRGPAGERLVLTGHRHVCCRFLCPSTLKAFGGRVYTGSLAEREPFAG